jgi:hypothetical protein
MYRVCEGGGQGEADRADHVSTYDRLLPSEPINGFCARENCRSRALHLMRHHLIRAEAPTEPMVENDPIVDPAFASCVRSPNGRDGPLRFPSMESA